MPSSPARVTALRGEFDGDTARGMAAEQGERPSEMTEKTTMAHGGVNLMGKRQSLRARAGSGGGDGKDDRFSLGMAGEAEAERTDRQAAPAQHAPQAGQGPAEIAGDGADGDAEFLGQRGLRLALHQMAHDDGLLPGVERAQGGRHGGEDLVQLRILPGRLGRGCQFGNRQRLMPALAATAVAFGSAAGQISGGDQPRRQAGMVLDAGRLAQEHEEHRLHRSLLCRRHQAPAGAPHEFVMTPMQQLERRGHAREMHTQQVRIGGLGVGFRLTAGIRC